MKEVRQKKYMQYDTISGKARKHNKNWKGTKIFEANSLDLEADLDYITILFMTEYLNSSCA